MKAVAILKVTAVAVPGFALIVAAAGAASNGIVRRGTAAPLTPVVVELFTSEGCSSCPPADALLRRLDDDQPIDGVLVVPLSEHVDYWNRLGWTDPFSSDVFTRRQGDYERSVFHTGRVYTPQAVIDGQLETVGSDERSVTRLVAEAARATKALVDLRTTERALRPGEVVVDVRVPALADGEADVVLALTEDDVESDVRRGENANRRLGHTGVVRRMQVLGSVDRHAAFSGSTTLRVASSWKASDLRVVVFVQQKASRRIVGAATAPFIPLAAG